MRLLSKVENRKHLLFLGQWNRQVQEGIKGNGHLRIEMSWKNKGLTSENVRL